MDKLLLWHIKSFVDFQGACEVQIKITRLIVKIC